MTTPILNRPPDFIATLKYFTTEQGGRQTPVKSKYFPLVEFPGLLPITGGQQIFLDKDIVYPGDTVKAEMRIISDEAYEGKLYVGQEFKVFEMPGKYIGTGVIVDILNKALLKKIDGHLS